jgi:hypothetical protein
MACCGKTPPPLRTQAKTASKAIGRFSMALVSGAPVFVADEIMARRLAVCRVCAHVIEHPTSDFLRCADCGCGLNGRVRFKARLATEQCSLPEPKWGKE